jgi:RimJ/RimL family protein N-acetyltransferase
MQIRLLEPADAEENHALRLEALSLSPEAFGSTYEETIRLSPEEILARSQCSDENFKVGAFSERRLVGIAGFIQSKRDKTRHRGDVVGMYVSPAYRGAGVGKTILQDVVERARRLEGLEQITLDLILPNQAARRLYLGMGFEVYGLHAEAIKVGGVGYDVELFALRLTAPRG